MFSGHATVRNLSRYSSYHERTFARWYARGFDFVSLNKEAIIQVIPPDHELFGRCIATILSSREETGVVGAVRAFRGKAD